VHHIEWAGVQAAGVAVTAKLDQGLGLAQRVSPVSGTVQACSSMAIGAVGSELVFEPSAGVGEHAPAPWCSQLAMQGALLQRCLKQHGISKQTPRMPATDTHAGTADRQPLTQHQAELFVVLSGSGN
jgi:hypothetical protein